MFLMSLTIELVVPCGSYRCGYLHIFLELSDREPTSYKTLGLHVMQSPLTMPFDDLMFFFLGLVDRALVHLFLRLDFVHI